ncbi:MAG: GumC family protein [Cellvibrionaceae bacterium]
METASSPFGSTQGNSENIDISHYIRLLMHNKWKIVAFVVLVTAIVIALVKPMRSVYQADTTVMIETNTNNIAGLQNVQTPNAQNREYFATQYEIIRSRALTEKVVDRLALTTHPEYDPRQAEDKKSWLDIFAFSKGDEESVLDLNDEEAEKEIRRKIIQNFDKSLTVEPLFGTFLVKISYKSHDADLAADIANAMADAYIESYLEARLSTAKKATSWLSDRLGELRTNLQASEERLQEYREAEQLVDVQGVRTLDAAELAQLREDYVDARQRRTEAQSIYNQVRNYESLSTGELLAIPTILNNRIIQRLVEAKSTADLRVAELSQRYGQQHPSMQAALSTQRESASELNSRLRSVAQGIYANYQAALRAEQALSSQINSTRGRLQNVSRKEVRLRELEREVETNRQLYDLFLSRGKESDESSKIEEPPARVIDEALPPIEPVGPNKAKFVVAAFVLSGALVVGFIVLLDLLDSTVRTSDDVENKLKASMLGFLPLDKSNKSDFAFRAFVNKTDKSGFAEAIRTIRTSLVLSSLDKPFKTIVVTSSVPGEGKSTVSLNIAEALGKMEKVVLIDADMRRPTMSKALGLSKSTMGLSNIIAGKASVEDCIHRLPDSEIDVIVSGTIPDNPLELIGSKQFKELLASLQETYDRIVIDSAPVHAVSDSQILSSYADSLIYIVKFNSTPVGVVTKGIKTLRTVNAPLTGVVLNQVDLSKAGQYDSAYTAYSEYGYATNAKS